MDFAVDFGHLDIVAMSDEAMVRILLANIVPWPPTPTKSTLFISDILFIPLSGNGLNRADLHADRTADAIHMSNTGFLRFTVIAQGRAAGGEAFLATNALIRIDDARRLVEVELGFIFFGILLRTQGHLVMMTDGSSSMAKAQSIVSFMAFRSRGLTVRTCLMPRL